MKYLFISPVVSRPDVMPLPGIPSLIGILEKNGIESEYLNLNGEYLRSLDIEEFIKYIKDLYDFLNREKYLSYPEYFQSAFVFMKERYDLKNLKWLKNSVKKIPGYLKLPLKEYYNYIYLNYFSSLNSYIRRLDFLSCCSHIFSSEVDFRVDIESILYIFNSPMNNLKKFYEKKVDEIIKSKPNIIGIQITVELDVLSGLFLGYLIKQKDKNIHINIGGNYFESYYKRIINLRDFFGIFFDSISIGDSTGTVLDLVNYQRGVLELKEVRNLVSYEDGKLQYKLNCKPNNIKELPYQSFKGYKREDYFLPELVLPVRATTTYSCYWGKCIFCSCSGIKEPYILLSVERFTDEIEYLSKKYNTKYFAFWDNAMPPQYIEKVADILIEKKLDIKYNFFARFEEEYTYELLKKLKRSGCMQIFWGLDSASPRVLEYINKGIKIENAENVLKYSHKAGICNFVYLILGHPTETTSELEENYNFVKRNYKYIDGIEPIKNVLLNNISVLTKNYGYYKKQINYSEEYKRYKEILAYRIKQKTKTMPDYSFLLVQYPTIYVSKYGRLRFKIINYLLYYYYNKHTNRYLKKLLDIYYQRELNKLYFIYIKGNKKSIHSII